jgi:hypothetical protein
MPAKASRGTDAPSVVSIVTFDPFDPRPITEEGTLRAMEYLGIDASELAMPPADQIDDDELRGIFVAHHRRRITGLLSEINAERDRLLAIYRENCIGSHRSPSSRRDRSPGPEDRPFEQLEKQHRRQIEAIVVEMLKAEEQQRDAKAKADRAAQIKDDITRRKAEQSAAARERQLKRERDQKAAAEEWRKQQDLKQMIEYEREQERLKALERLAQQKLDRMRQVEAARQERAERNRDVLQKLEDDRITRFRQQEIHEQERAIAFLEQQRQDHERQHQAHFEENCRKQRVLTAIRMREEEEMETRKREADDREYYRELWFGKFREEKSREREEMKVEHETRVQRYMVQKSRIEKKLYDRRLKSAADEEVINSRIQSVEAQRQKETRKRAFIQQLKKEERDHNAEHVRRRKEVHQRDARLRMQAEQDRIASFEEGKTRALTEKRERAAQLERKRTEMDQVFQAQLAANEASFETIAALAKSYGVDVDDLRTRHSRRPAARTIRVSKFPGFR